MSEEQQKKKIPEGPPLFIESLLEAIEYAKTSKKYPNTWQSAVYRGVQDFKPNEFKCRWRMGSSLNDDEIVTINHRMRELAKSKGITLKF